MLPGSLQAPPRGPPRGARPPKGIVNEARDSLSAVRTHTYSIAIAHHSDDVWSVAIVQKTLRRGQVVDEQLSYGPTWTRETALAPVVLDAVERLQKLVRDDKAG